MGLKWESVWRVHRGCAYELRMAPGMDQGVAQQGIIWGLPPDIVSLSSFAGVQRSFSKHELKCIFSSFRFCMVIVTNMAVSAE